MIYRTILIRENSTQKTFIKQRNSGLGSNSIRKHPDWWGLPMYSFSFEYLGS
jgi:hypothetical protein